MITQATVAWKFPEPDPCRAPTPKMSHYLLGQSVESPYVLRRTRCTLNRERLPQEFGDKQMFSFIVSLLLLIIIVILAIY